MNVLFVTLDQFRGDCLGVAGHPVVKTPNLDALANDGVRLARHYSQSAPCSPGRAALYTSTYQMNNRVVANGTPHRASLDNVAFAARRAGYDPTLFGYTDQGLDPALAVGPNDPRLTYYSGILRGFSIGCYLPEDQSPWTRWLSALGYDTAGGWQANLEREPTRPVAHSLSSFLTDRFLDWHQRRDGPWFAHLSYLRPHPPYAAAGEYAALFTPEDVDDAISPVGPELRHPLHEFALVVKASAAPTGADLRALRAQYYGMIAEIDHQMGRVIAAIRQAGEWSDTLIVVTADHGEQLGDHGLKEKLGFFPQSYHIIGLWRDPRRSDAGRTIEQFTENVDLLPTLCEAMGIGAPGQADGRSLTELLDGDAASWRSTAHYEWDWRFIVVGQGGVVEAADRSLSAMNLAVGVSADTAYVQFGDGSFKCYDVGSDPTWRTECADPPRVLAAAQELLCWRQDHLNRDLTDCLLEPGRPGRWPVAVG